MSESTELLDDDTYVPAVIATLAWIGIGVALDVYLIIRRKNRLISDVFRTKPGKAFLGVFCLHIANRLGKADPFHYAGERISSRRVIAEPVAVIGGLADAAQVIK